MTEGAARSLVRVVRVPGETWVSHCGDDGSLVDILLHRDSDQPLFGAIHLARLSRSGGRPKGPPGGKSRGGGSAATATLCDGTSVWVDPAPAHCAVTGRPATDGALVAVRIVEEARSGKLPRASGRIEVRGRRLVLVAGEAGVRLSHRLVAQADRKVLSDRLGLLPKDAGAWLATRWAADGSGDLLAAEAARLCGILSGVREKARMSGAPVELLPARDPIEECLLERVPAGSLRIETNSAALKSRVDAILGQAALSDLAAAVLDLGLTGPWFDAAIEGQLQDALGPTVAFPGGRVHIEPTQALTAVDVDGDPHMGFAQINRRAADVVMRQVRLREVGGILVIDPAGPSTVQTAKAMIVALEKRAQADPYTVKAHPGAAGLVTLIRERRRPSLAERLGERLGGGGRATEAFAPSRETSALKALSYCIGESVRARGGRQLLEVAPDVAQYLQDTTAGQAALQEARRSMAMDLVVTAREGLGADEAALGTEGDGANG